MNPAELDALLRQFLVEGKLAPHERAALKEWAAKQPSAAEASRLLFATARSAAVGGNAAALVDFLEQATALLSSR